MAEHDATRADVECGARDEVELRPVPVEAAVSAGTGITGSDYGAAGGSDENQTVASDFTGSIDSAGSQDPSGDAHQGEAP